MAAETFTFTVTDAAGHASAAKTLTVNWQQPVPPSSGPVVGMNFRPAQFTENAAYEKLAKVARVYVSTGQTDITKQAEFARARAAGISRFVLSWKDTAVPAWLRTVPAGVTWYGCAHHEPEGDYANNADWRALQALHMPAVRAAGGIPTAILMTYTLDPASGRVVNDYVLPKGLVDIYGFDLYPTKVTTQAAYVQRIKTWLPSFGVSRYLLGEYGVATSDPTLGVQLINALKPLVTDAEAICYWSSQVTGATDYHFTTATADAWYA